MRAHGTIRSVVVALARGLWGRVSQTPGGGDLSRRETFLAIRRVDGELMQGEYLWETAVGSDGWEGAVLDAEWRDDPIEYELVEMTVRPLGRRSLPVFEEE